MTEVRGKMTEGGLRNAEKGRAGRKIVIGYWFQVSGFRWQRIAGEDSRQRTDDKGLIKASIVDSSQYYNYRLVSLKAWQQRRLKLIPAGSGF